MICPRSEHHNSMMRLKTYTITTIPELPLEKTYAEAFAWRHHWVGCCPICHTHVEVTWDEIKK